LFGIADGEFGVRPTSSTPAPGEAASRTYVLALLKEKRMNILIWLVVGGVIGWIASLLVGTDAQQGVVLNVVVGIVGALVGGWLISPMLGVGTINEGAFNLASLGVSLAGAVILLVIVNLIRRGTARG
jgi:uncharacterized membrane protein YeaQ/YmgE (transglycosylase-associated protein family)